MVAPTMRVTGAGCVIIGPEGRTPPLPFVTVPKEEGESFIALKLATAFTGEAPEPEVDAEAEAAAAEAAAKAKAEADAAEAEAKAKAEADEAEAKAKAEADALANANPEGAAAAERLATITESLDLMEAGDLVKTGERAGKPTVKAMEAATGLNDLTVDEIDAAIAAKESAD